MSNSEREPSRLGHQWDCSQMTGTAESGRCQTRRKEQVRKQSQRRSLGGKQQLRWMLKTAELGRAWSNKLALEPQAEAPISRSGKV